MIIVPNTTKILSMNKEWVEYALLLIFLTASLALAIASYYQISVLFFILGLFLLIVWKRGARSGIKSAATQISFANRIIAGYEAGVPLITILKGFAEQKYGFSSELAIGLKRYCAGEPPSSSFSALRQLGHRDLNLAIDILEDCLQNGTDPVNRLKRVVGRMEQTKASSLRVLGQMNNAIYINKLGSALFFPLFCGMGIQMLLASPTGPSMQGAADQIAILLTGFIIISNYICNALTDPRFTEGFAWFMGLSSIGVLVFRLSSVLALNFV